MCFYSKYITHRKNIKPTSKLFHKMFNYLCLEFKILSQGANVIKLFTAVSYKFL